MNPLNNNSQLTPCSITVIISFEEQYTDGMRAHPSKDTHLDSSLDHQEPSEVLQNYAFTKYYIYLKKFSVYHHIESTSPSYIST